MDGANGLAARVVSTRALAERQVRTLEERSLTRLFREVELPLVEVLLAVERVGMKVDLERLAEIPSAQVLERIAVLEGEIYEMAGREFTIGSPQQLAEVLFERLGLSRKRRGKTGFSTDARVLAAIRDEHPMIAAIEEVARGDQAEDHLPRRVAPS